MRNTLPIIGLLSYSLWNHQYQRHLRWKLDRSSLPSRGLSSLVFYFVVLWLLYLVIFYYPLYFYLQFLADLLDSLKCAFFFFEIFLLAKCLEPNVALITESSKYLHHADNHVVLRASNLEPIPTPIVNLTPIAITFATNPIMKDPLTSLPISTPPPILNLLDELSILPLINGASNLDQELTYFNFPKLDVLLDSLPPPMFFIALFHLTCRPLILLGI